MSVTVRQAVTQFMAVQAGRGLAAATLVRQQGGLDGRYGFVQACQKIKGPNPTMGQVDFECVSAYFLSHTGGNGSRNNKLIVLRKFLKWAETRKLLRPGFSATALVEDYTQRKVTRARKLYVEPDRFAEMLDTAGEHHPRDRAVVALILYTLARQSEITPMRLKHLDLDVQVVQIYRQKVKRHTETGISPELRDEMTEWLNWYAGSTGHASAAAMVAEHPDWHLVPAGQRGRHWDRMNPERPMVSSERIMRRVLSTMGYQELRSEGCHTGRRSGARAMFKYLRDVLGYEGALVRVQAMLDHESPRR